MSDQKYQNFISKHKEWFISYNLKTSKISYQRQKKLHAPMQQKKFSMLVSKDITYFKILLKQSSKENPISISLPGINEGNFVYIQFVNEKR